jgi:hypothetical protein
MHNNYYEESSVANKEIHILQYISLAEYKIMGYPAPAISVDSGLAAPSLVYALPDDSAAYIYFNGPSTRTHTNYMYSIDNGVTYTIRSPAAITSPIKISNLVNGSTYQIKLKAISAIGEGTESTSLSVIPSASSNPSPWLYFDPANPSSYSGAGSIFVNNVGSYGALTGTKVAAVTYVDGIGLSSRKVFDFNGAPGSVISFSNPFNFGTTISVCAWIYPRARQSDTINGLLTNAGANVITNGFKFQWNWWNSGLNQPGSRNIGFQAGNGQVGGGDDDSSPAGIIQHNEWQHVSYVFDQANRKILFFWNGVPTIMGSDAIPVANIGMNQSFNIGGYVGGSYTMNAQLGYIKVFNTLLSASDVYAEFNSSKSTFNL